MQDDLILDHETRLETWRPAFRIFLRKLLFVAALTTLALLPVIVFFGVIAWLAASLLGSLVYFLVLDDYAEWQDRRGDTWVLTDQRLIFCRGDAPDDPGIAPLEEITRVSRWMWWGVKLQFANRTATVMLFLPNSATVRDKIDAARTARLATLAATPH